MKTVKAELSKALKDYLKYGGITGGETPSKLQCIPAKFGPVLGVAFDPARHKHEECKEIGEEWCAHAVKAKDGREAYFEVKNDKLYAFISQGLNVEIWNGLLVVGSRSDRDSEMVKKRGKFE